MRLQALMSDTIAGLGEQTPSKPLAHYFAPPSVKKRSSKPAVVAVPTEVQSEAPAA